MYIDDKGFLEVIKRESESDTAKSECVYAQLHSGEWLCCETSYKKNSDDYWVVDKVDTSVSVDKPDEEGKEEKLEKLAEAIRAMKKGSSY